MGHMLSDRPMTARYANRALDTRTERSGRVPNLGTRTELPRAGSPSACLQWVLSALGVNGTVVPEM